MSVVMLVVLKIRHLTLLLFLPMAIWRNKIETAVHSVIDDITTIESTLVSKKSLKLVVNVLNYGSEAEISIIMLVTEGLMK